MWLSVLLESVRWIKLFKPPSKLIPAIGCWRAFFPPLFSFLFLLHLLKMLTLIQNALFQCLSTAMSPYSGHLMYMPQNHFQTFLQSTTELTWPCLPPMTPRNHFQSLLSRHFPLCDFHSFIQTQKRPDHTGLGHLHLYFQP